MCCFLNLSFTKRTDCALRSPGRITIKIPSSSSSPLHRSTEDFGSLSASSLSAEEDNNDKNNESFAKKKKKSSSFFVVTSKIGSRSGMMLGGDEREGSLPRFERTSSGGGYELYSSNNDDDNTNTNNNTNGGGRMPFRDVGSNVFDQDYSDCLLYTSPSPRDRTRSRMPSSA